MLSSREEILVPLPSPRERVRTATEVRSTLLCTSVQALRARGFGDAYFAALAPHVRDAVLSLTAGLWLPIEVAVEHYLACDRLELQSSVIYDIGSEVGRRINESVVSIFVRLSREAGVTPWIALTNVPKLNDRLWRGGALSVVKIGPKDGRLEWFGQPCARSPYYRMAFSTFVTSVLDLFCTRSYAREIPSFRSDTSMAYRFSWA